MARSKTHKNKSKTRNSDDEQQMKSRSKMASEEEPLDMDVEDVEQEVTELDEEAEEEVTELDEEEGDAEDTELDVDDEEEAEADEDDEDVNDIEDDEDEDEDDEEESIDDGPTAPPAKITKLAVLLILLNWLVAPLFVYLAYVDHMVRVQYAYRVNYNYIQIWGLPLRGEDDPSFANETRPLLVLNSEQLKAAFESRKGTDRKATASAKFAPFEESVDKRIPIQIRPKDMTADLLKDVFQGHPDPAVPTLEDEIERLGKGIDKDVKDAADDLNKALKDMKEENKRKLLQNANFTFSYDSLRAKKLETQLEEAKGADLDTLVKRHIIRMTLYTIAPMAAYTPERAKDDPANFWQIKQLEDRLEKANGKELDDLFDDAVQRRIYYDVLAPINLYRPGDTTLNEVENLADLKKYPLDKVKGLLAARFKEVTEAVEPSKRDSLERRQRIAFIMFTLSQASAPLIDRKVYPKGIERAQIVCGLYEFTNASIFFVRAQRILEERIVNAIIADREGYITEVKDKAGQLTRTPGFAGHYKEEVDRLVLLVKQIDDAQKRKADLIVKRDEYDKLYKLRLQQREDTLQKLLTERRNTAKYILDLRQKQDELHTALVELSEAGDRNIRLESEIRAIETRLLEEAARLDAAAKKGKKRP